MSEDVAKIAERLRAQADEKRHLDLPLTVKPSDVLAVLDELDARPARRARRTKEG